MFKNRFCFLIDGHLLEYDVRRRDIYGQALETVYHHRRFAFSLRDCYIYSGTLATSVLGPDTSGSDWRLSNSAENFPRIFENGLMSHDSTIDCSFVIWKKLRARGKAGKGLGSSSTVRVYRTRNKVGYIFHFSLVCIYSSFSIDGTR